MKIRLAAPVTKDSIVDGPGLRMVIWTQGCPHRCKGCHNPQTHRFDGGFETEVDDIIEQMKNLKLHRGITISGGEPLEQPEACREIAEAAKNMGLDVWVYTGYTFEAILDRSESDKRPWAELLKVVDVIIDGPFILEKKNMLLRFRGSENQRIIDVSESLKNKKVILYNNL